MLENNVEQENSIQYEFIPKEDWEKYKELRLEALKNEPISFGSSYEEEVVLSDDKWSEKLNKSYENDIYTMLFAKNGNTLIGMIGMYKQNSIKSKHIVNIYGVYVDKKYRGRGIGSGLMNAMLENIDKMKDIEKIKLSVVAENKNALKLYEKFGFKIAGKYLKELKVENKYYDEYLMEKLKS